MKACNLKISDRKPKLMDWEKLIDSDVLKNECKKCIQRNTCREIVKLLKSGLYDKAKEILDTLK